MGSDMWSIKHRQFQWSPVTFQVIHPLQVFSNGIFRTVLSKLTRFQLTCCVARSLGDG